MLDTVLQAKTVLAGVKTLALVLNRVLVACIAAACNFFFLGHLGHMTSLIHHISHHFENCNKQLQHFLLRKHVAVALGIKEYRVIQ